MTTRRAETVPDWTDDSEPTTMWKTAAAGADERTRGHLRVLRFGPAAEAADPAVLPATILAESGQQALDEEAASAATQLSVLGSQVEILTSLMRMATEVARLLDACNELEQGPEDRRAVFPAPQGANGPMVVELLSSLQRAAGDVGATQRGTLIRLLNLLGETGLGLAGAARIMATELRGRPAENVQLAAEPIPEAQRSSGAGPKPPPIPTTSAAHDWTPSASSEGGPLAAWVQELARHLRIEARARRVFQLRDL